MKYETYELLVAVQVCFQLSHTPSSFCKSDVTDRSTDLGIVAIDPLGSMDVFRRLSGGDAVVDLDTGVPFPTISVSCRICL